MIIWRILSRLKSIMFSRVFCLSILSLIWIYSILPLSSCICCAFAIYIVTGGWRFLRLLWYTAPRDASAAVKLLKVKWRMRQISRSKTTITQIFEKNVDRTPSKVMFVCNDMEYTFKQIDDLSNKIANYFSSQDLRHGDVVDLVMDSKPEFVALWLGLAKIGCTSSLVNTNLRNQSLVHCIKVAEPKAVIVDPAHAEAVDHVRNELSDDYKYYVFGNADSPMPNMISLDEEIRKSSSAHPSLPPKANPSDSLMYIYTSGTTGLPKAAVITHYRYIYNSVGICEAFGIREGQDVVYVCLPIYHTSGGILGIGQAVVNGCTAVIRPKFSASRYWADCIQHNCTVGMYIGEVCRYLLAQPEAQSDKQHKIRLLIGNGLRPHIWPEFVRRFAIPKIGEFYGATEGNCSVMNTDGKVGAVGFMSLIAPRFYPIMLIKIDPDTGAIVRDRNGLCVQCGPGEIGHLVGKISADDPTRRFDGYIDKLASKKKIVCNVIRKGDSAFLSGDLLERDDLGYLYFRDRTGDTFRWKGENVSTTEVEGVMMKALDNTDVVVYGVPVPGCEGTAGMAAIACSGGDVSSLNLSALYQAMHDSLPTYSVPLFLRLLTNADNYKTGTFKLKKTELQKDSFNKESVPDPILFIDNHARTFTEMTYETYRAIRSGAFRF